MTPSAGALRSASVNCWRSKRELRLRCPELGFRRRDVLLARPGLGEDQGLACDLQLGVGRILGGLGGIDLALRHRRPAAGAVLERGQTLVGQLGIVGVGPGRVDIGLRLGDFLRPCAVVQLLHRRRLRRHLGLGLRDLRRDAAGVEAGEHFALLHLGAFVDQHLRDPPAVDEGEVDLAQVDIAVEHQRTVAVAVMVEPPPGEAAAGGKHDDQEDDDPPHDLAPSRMASTFW